MANTKFDDAKWRRGNFNEESIPTDKQLTEEYVESMDSHELSNLLGKIGTLWTDWKKGPLTEPRDIKPAQKELTGWITRWMKQNIK